MRETEVQIGNSGLLSETDRTRVACPASLERRSMSSGQQIDRRTFMKVSSGVLAAGIAPSLAAEASPSDETPYPVKWYPFTGHPDSDTCWSFSVGPDGRIYAAACAETVPGGVVKPVRYNEQRDDLATPSPAPMVKSSSAKTITAGISGSTFRRSRRQQRTLDTIRG